jgi:murein DD-endopeptidase MepM/ murein hydrolase activator NlpD
MTALWLAFLWLVAPGQTSGPTVTIAARALQPGELVVATIATPADVERVDVHAFGHALVPVRIGEGRWQAIFGIDLDVKPGAYTVRIDVIPPNGSVATSVTINRTLTVRPKTFPTRRLTVDDAFVNPPPSVEARIASEAAELEHLWAASTPRHLWTAPFVAPVSQPANSAFGTRSVFNGQPRSPHGGADFPSPAGTPVHAPSAGRIRLARDLYYTGNTVVLDHGAGLVSLFAHLSRIDVQDGDDVVADQVIGLVGATGRVTGPHLHWTLRASGARVDPLSLLAVLGRQ